MTEGERRKDFFISYTSADRTWAEWIAWQLEAEGYTTVIQAWDFGPGSNFVLAMNTAAKAARRTLAVLSPDYFHSGFASSEWAARFRQDPRGEQRLVVPVRVRPCDVEGLLGPIVYIDLVDHDEQTARTLLLAGVHAERAKPSAPPAFPPVTPPAAERPPFPITLPSLWNVPYRRNPFFTGREELLSSLRDRLHADKATALTQPQAISGLGGIGKTQTALEYAYRYRDEYRYVLWVNASTREELLTSYLELATRLQLPERGEQDQNVIVAAVKAWFVAHDGWLVIFDNADELALVEDFLPPAGNGYVLLTMRAQAPGMLGSAIEVEQMSPQEGMVLLLRRAKVLTLDAPLEQARASDRTTAEAIVAEMGGLPLALDQAGAYIEETQCSLASYLQQYRKQQARFLQRRGGTGKQHPEPVATTWSLSFERVEALDPLAADLLRLCAFLAPEAIPEHLIIAGAAELGPRFHPLVEDASLLDESIGTLLRFSLIKRKGDEATLAVHRLVQAVLRNSMDAATQRAWAEHIVRAVNRAFPAVTDYRNWPLHQQYLPHAQACAALIDRWEFVFPEAASLSNKVGYYLDDRARYPEAEGYYQRAIAIGEKTLGPEHPDLATRLNNLAVLYRTQGKYAEAEPLYQRALAIYEQRLGSRHPDTRIIRANYARFLRSLHREAEARQLETRSAESSQQP